MTHIHTETGSTENIRKNLKAEVFKLVRKLFSEECWGINTEKNKRFLPTLEEVYRDQKGLYQPAFCRLLKSLFWGSETLTAAGPSLSPSWRRQRRNTSLYDLAWTGLPFLAIRWWGERKAKYSIKLFPRVLKTQTSSLQFPWWSGGTWAWNGGGEAPADSHSPPWKLTETTQGTVDPWSSRDSPLSTKLKHPSPVKQAW